MRFTLAQLLTALLVFALVLALFVNHRRAQLQIAEHDARADARERLEDHLERTLIDRLTPGLDLAKEPYYRVLVDNTILGDDPGFDACVEFIAKNIDDAPASFDGCELHEFRFRESDAFESHYVVIVRDNCCICVFWAGGSMRPV